MVDADEIAAVTGELLDPIARRAARATRGQATPFGTAEVEAMSRAALWSSVFVVLSRPGVMTCYRRCLTSA